MKDAVPESEHDARQRGRPTSDARQRLNVVRYRPGASI